MTTLTRDRSLLLTPSLFAALRTLGDSGPSRLGTVEQLREAGYQAGESFHSLLEESIAEAEDDLPTTELPTRRFWDQFSRFWAASGWGDLQHRELHPGVSVLESSDWIEAELTGGVSGCHVTTGILADLLRRVAGQEIAVFEVECRGRQDERCRFLIGSPETLQALYAAVRRGATLEKAVSELS